MSLESRYVENNGLGWVGETATAAAILFPTIFGGGKHDAKRRDQKREALSQVGFNWRPTSGVPAGEEWNIDNWDDNSLDNIAMAYQQYGQIVADLHNSRQFHPGNTQTLQQIEQVIQANGGSVQAGWGSQGYYRSGFNATPWVIGAGVLVLGGAAYSVMSQKPGKKRK